MQLKKNIHLHAEQKKTRLISHYDIRQSASCVLTFKIMIIYFVAERRD